MGSTNLFVDEDTCATNFMIRDDKMMELVAPHKEPITPFIHKVRSLYKQHGVSTILVIGGSGDYFQVADHVLMMDSYACLDVTDKAKAIVERHNGIKSAATSNEPSSSSFGTITNRYPIGHAFLPPPNNSKINVRARTIVTYGDGLELDLGGLEQIVHKSQTHAIASSIQQIATRLLSNDPSANGGNATTLTLATVLRRWNELIDREGLDVVLSSSFNNGGDGDYNGVHARPRMLEIAGAMNRLRRDGTFRQKPR
uniref:Uncharacterized protein n=1 Tax=Proboscia inermis TaxID=420281 RepID=A0A7S0C1B9_9STRA|mmetsp:Transcript_21345/g.21667  ORF Transcript_21345/g.21667 Transcript_21345/m.21667 type:complete len:255 (+) Transcript_21345:148-912(+)